MWENPYEYEVTKVLFNYQGNLCYVEVAPFDGEIPEEKMEEFAKMVKAHGWSSLNMADSFVTAYELNFSLPIKNALKAVEDVIFTNFHFRPSYEIVNLAETRVDINSCERDYTQEFSSILNKQGLYVIFEIVNDDSTVSDIFYVGKAGKRGGDYAVFYTTKGGSGRLPLHIQGSDDTIFAKASHHEKDTKEYANFVDKYSVLCMIIDSEQIGDRFEKLLLLWEAYLILVLMPKMNETLEFNFDMEVIRSSNSSNNVNVWERLTSAITEVLPKFV